MFGFVQVYLVVGGTRWYKSGVEGSQVGGEGHDGREKDSYRG